MKTVDEIASAAAALNSGQLLRLRKKLDLLEIRLWKGELAAASKKMKKAAVNEQEIDRLVMRRRRESRS